MSTRRQHDERGATAVVVAISASMIFGIAALSVDLGNAWAHKRDLQTQADLAALAAAVHLPATGENQDDIGEVVDRYLGYCHQSSGVCDPDPNFVWGQDPAVVDWDSVANGYVKFASPAEPGFNLDDLNRLTVSTPPATVDYGLAHALGFKDVDLTASATVEIRSPGPVLPFFLLNQSECSWGPQVMKAGPRSGDESEPTETEAPPPATWDPAGLETNHDFELTRVTSLEVSEGDTSQRILLEGTSRSSYADGTPVIVHFNHATAPAQSVSGTADWESKDRGVYPWHTEVVVPAEVSSTDGVWWVRVQRNDGMSPGTNMTGQDTAKDLSVSSTADADDKCGEKNLGDFGLLDSPRFELGVTEKEQYALNTELGMDHTIEPSTDPGAMDEECDGTGSDVLDNENLAEGEDANCVFIENGNKTAWLTLGLFGDYAFNGTTYHGRMRKPTTDYCQDKGLPEYTTAGVYTDVNADTLECFVQPPETVDTVSAESYLGEPSIAPEIFESPRFIWVPVLNASANPGHGYYATVGFRPAFITDIGFNDGGEGVHEINVIAFNPDALPETVVSSGPGIEYLGIGTKLVRLVE